MPPYNSKRVNADLDAVTKALKARGMTLPKNRTEAAKTVQALQSSPSASDLSALRSNLSPGSQIERMGAAATKEAIATNERLSREFGNQRAKTSRLNQRRSNTSSAGGDVFAAIPRFYDPMEYWDLSGLPWNMADEGHRHKLHKWLRLYYMTHPLISTLVDIFTRFPLAGMDLTCKDNALTDFYEDLFMDRLEYPDFMVQMGREYWQVGECYPNGSFHEGLGIWDAEELINPENIQIENFPLLSNMQGDGKQIKIVPPEYLKRLVQSKSPPQMYKQLEIGFPELIPYLKRGEAFPVSDVLLKQIAFKTNSWDDHGTPILLRGLRMLLHQEKLFASQDAVAERMYSPLILAKLGTQDLGDGVGPWIPGPQELDDLRDAMDVALSSDFRLIVHHFALEVETVFGRENVPDLGNDFDRIDRTLMQIFGVNPSLLSAGSNNQPYASSALQAEFMNQMLRTYQGFLRKHYQDRAFVVAEAQEHYEYEKKGQTRIPVFEEVLVVDDDGNERIEKRHKLLIPDLDFAVLDMRDEATERAFLQTLRQMGVPIADEHMMIGVTNFDFDETLDKMGKEMVKKTVAQQEAKMTTYKILLAKGLPIPPELAAEIMTAGTQGGGGAPDAGAPGPAAGPGSPVVMPESPDGGVPGGGPPVTEGIEGGTPGPVPEVSNERRPGLTYNRASAKLRIVSNTKTAKTVTSVSDIPDGEEEDYEILEPLPRNKRNANSKMRLTSLIPEWAPQLVDEDDEQDDS